MKVLAESFLAGELTPEAVSARVSRTLGRRWSWIEPLSRRYFTAFGPGTRPRERDLLRFLGRDRGMSKAWARHSEKLSITHWLNEPMQMKPVQAARNWDLPEIVSTAALAEWLGVEVGELEWFADRKGIGAKARESRLRHYHYTVLAKLSGSIRLIEAPKSRLKQIQRRILTGILDKVPPHRAVHGFVRERSIKTFTAPHVGQRVVVRLDFRDFFPSFPAARIQAVFRTLGYPDLVADLLAGLCTTATARDAWRRAAFGEDPLHLWESRGDAERLYERRHLPQGAPTSPALANICTYRLDCRMEGLAKAAGAVYTRYADDLAFSGDRDFEGGAERFAIHVAAVLAEEGFRLNHRKTRIMRRGVRQHLAGMVVNERMNIRRQEFDRLKATLINCVRLGPETQNRNMHPLFRQHLEGRLGFVEMINPVKGTRLRRIFDRIEWGA